MPTFSTGQLGLFQKTLTQTFSFKTFNSPKSLKLTCEEFETLHLLILLSYKILNVSEIYARPLRLQIWLPLKTFEISPQEESKNWGGNNMLLFPKLNKVKMEHAQQKKNVPNSAKIMGECFAECLFCGPEIPGGKEPGLIWARPKHTLVQHWRS